MSYSSNIATPEDNKILYQNDNRLILLNELNYLSIINITTFLFPKKCFGYNYHQDLLQSARLQVDRKYNTKLSNLNYERYVSNPLQLGFEVTNNNLVKYDILLFDTPPIDEIKLISSSIYGYNSLSFDYYKNFIIQILETTRKLKLNVLLKTKYSSTNYVSKYDNFLKSLNNYKLTVVNSPYTEIDGVLNSSAICISYPISGLYNYAKDFGLTSLVYFPRIEDEGHRNFSNKDFIYGQRELEITLLRIIEANEGANVKRRR